ncbi:MAG: ABC transporter ATP-binding protein, partial [Candidatus Hydrogenedentes bacterium]|nr:ABC transporter ATP-binding protein [Candidatus Hydrogenedentota bacterium]
MSEKKKSRRLSNVWFEAKEIMWRHRKRIALGLGLMLISRLAGFVLPLSIQFLIDDVLPNKNTRLLIFLAIGAGLATLT